MSDTPKELTTDIQIGIAIAVLPLLIYFKNPAIALLAGSILSLSINARIIPKSEVLSKYALQIAIILLGLKLDASLLVQLSADYSVMVTVYILATLAIGFSIGYLVKNDTVSNQLVSSGTAICGGTTIASLAPIVKARPDQTAVALTLVFLLNAVALFSYPYIGDLLKLSQEQFGVWCALSIHDTASVVATAFIYGEESGAVATTIKLGRTLWLIPLLVVASMLCREDTKVKMPVFIILFILAAMTSSFFDLPALLINSADIFSKALLVFALFCIGTEISRKTLRQLRGSTAIQGLILWFLVAPITLAAVYFYV